MNQSYIKTVFSDFRGSDPIIESMKVIPITMTLRDVINDISISLDQQSTIVNFELIIDNNKIGCDSMEIVKNLSEHMHFDTLSITYKVRGPLTRVVFNKVLVANKKDEFKINDKIKSFDKFLTDLNSKDRVIKISGDDERTERLVSSRSSYSSNGKFLDESGWDKSQLINAEYITIYEKGLFYELWECIDKTKLIYKLVKYKQ